MCPQLETAGYLAFLWVAGIFFALFFHLLGKYVSITKTMKDNEVFNAIVSHWFYVALAFALYLFFRIPLPSKEDK